MKKTVAILWVLFITLAVGYQYYEGYDTTGAKSALSLGKDTGDTVTADDFDAIDTAVTDNDTRLDTIEALTGPVFSDGDGTYTDLSNISATELGLLNGLTSSTAELNILDGLTSNTAEINLLDGKTDIASADGDVYTGTHDFGGADDLEIPNGTAPTVDTDGQIAHDTSADQMIVGASATVFDSRFEQCVVFENLAAADDNFEIWEFLKGVTLTYVSAHCRGTCTTEATIGFEDRAGNAVSLDSTLTASSGTGNSTPIAVSSGGTFVSGEGLCIDVTNAVSPETDEYTICFMGTTTRE